MKRLEDIVQSLEAHMVSNEKYYRFDVLLEQLNCSCNELIEIEDYILTPYYISMGKRMELYEYELKIVADKKQSFERYLLDLTGKRRIDDIPNSIVERQKICYIECEPVGFMIRADRLKKYIKFLLYNNDIQCQIKECFGLFKIDNMFFAIY